MSRSVVGPSVWSRITVLVCVATFGIALAVAGGGPAFGADPIRGEQWRLGYLKVDEAQRHSQGNGIAVGVVDTGVDADHPDLAGSILSGYAVPPLTQDPKMDLNGHGTAMAGLIVAHGRALGI